MTSPLTPSDLRQAAELVEKATPGPWQPTPGYQASQKGDYADDVSVIEDATGEPVIEHVFYDGHHTIVRPHDVAFIAASRTLVPRLLAEVERLRIALDKACVLAKRFTVPEAIGEEASRIYAEMIDELRKEAGVE